MGKRKIKDELCDEVAELLSDNWEDYLDEQINQAIDEEMEEKIEHFEIVQKIEKLRQVFDEVDEYFEQLPFLQSANDEYIQDLLHYVETHNFTQASAYKFVQLLKEKRNIRRGYKRDWEIKTYFNDGRDRFSLNNQREIFMNNLYQKEKRLLSEYRYRQIEEDEITNLISVKRGRKKNSESEVG